MNAIAADIARASGRKFAVDLWQAYTAIKAPPAGFRFA